MSGQSRRSPATTTRETAPIDRGPVIEHDGHVHGNGAAHDHHASEPGTDAISGIGDWLTGIGQQLAPEATGGQTAAQGSTQAQGQATEGALQLGLGADVDTMVGQSPTLDATIRQLQADGWTINTGPASGGTFANRDQRTITISEGKLSDPASVVQSLAHEAGHAAYDLEDYIGFGDLSREDYVEQNRDRNLRDEAEATFMNLQVREELAGLDTPVNIGVSGANSAAYIASYEQYRAGNLTREALIDRIANQFAEGETPSTDTSVNYGQYYGRTYEEHWDNHHPSATGGGS